MSDPLTLDRQVCFALAAASRRVIGLYRPVLEPLGITHPQYLVLLALWEQTPLRVNELAEALYLDSATLSPLLKRLEAAGLIERHRSTDDERVLDVTLTEKGRALRAQAENVPPQIVARLGMPLAELEEIRDRLSALIAASEPAAAN